MQPNDMRPDLRRELDRIALLQRRWNALSVAEKRSIAKGSPDLTAFFRRAAEPRVSSHR